MQEKLFKTQNTQKNKKLVQEIHFGLLNLRKDYHNTPDENVMEEKLNEIRSAVGRILKHNENHNREGQGLKMLTLQQMLSRLPISLTQLKAGNNSEKLKK